MIADSIATNQYRRLLQGVQGVAGDVGGVRHEHTHGVRRPSNHVMVVDGTDWLLCEQEDDGGEECEEGLKMRSWIIKHL